ncbi:MAG: protein kinase [Blastocatellia bacterium]
MNRCAHCFGDLPEFAVFCPHCARADEPDFQQLLNQTIAGRYRLYKRLGQGGLSTVFAATDLQTDRVVVVKVSDPAQLVQRELSYAIDAEAARNYWHEMLERMRIEAETLARIEHPNIVRFYDTGMLGADLRFVVMEFLHGYTLREELDAKGRMDSAEAVRIALGICAALTEVHARDIVHRDINPRNVMLEGDTKLIDFGIAKFPQPAGAPPLTQHSVLSGTVAYASPEQCQSRAVDARSDIYSLGVVLYEMLAGERPFNGRTPTEIALKQIQAEPAPLRQLNPGVPASLERTVLRMLAKNPEDRQQDIEQLMEDLRHGARQVFVPLQAEDVASDEVENTLEDESPDSLDNRLLVVRRRRRRVAVAAAAVVLVAAAAGLLFGKNWLASRFTGSPVARTANVNALPSPSPSIAGATASDADSLELAAQLPSDNSASIASKKAPSTVQISSAAKLSEVNPSSSAVATKAQAKQPPISSPPAKPVMTKATPQTVAKSQPQTRPAPTPAVRAPQVSNPPPPEPAEVAQASRKPENPENNDQLNRDSINAGRTAGSPDTEASASRRERVILGRNRSEGASNSRRQPREQDADIDDSQEPRRLGPKLIQWSGSVTREREVTIDLPGVPGILEIPRVYRNRIGIVQPPSASNGWRTATVRVFGQGGVSFVVRWWPMGTHDSRVAERQ